MSAHPFTRLPPLLLKLTGLLLAEAGTAEISSISLLPGLHGAETTQGRKGQASGRICTLSYLTETKHDACSGTFLLKLPF